LGFIPLGEEITSRRIYGNSSHATINQLQNVISFSLSWHNKRVLFLSFNRGIVA
jgi:hypothetical protein